MSNQLKQIRGQIRQIVKELLPELITQELTTAMYKQVSGELQAKLSVIDGQIKESLKQMDDRAKDMQSFIMREMLSNIKAQPVEQPEAPKAE